MAREPAPDLPPSSPPAGLERLWRDLQPQGRALPPVERWNPPFCGDIDIRIAADGGWHYNGTPIGRPALVRLFASVLKKEADRFFLVTPVEKLGIQVDDAPFQAVEMAVEGEGPARRLVFRTNLDEVVAAGPDHPLRFVQGPEGGLKPYIHVRRDLWARLTRALTFDLVDLAEPSGHGETAEMMIRSDGAAFPLGPVAPDGAQP
jgi:hypothetical protein